MKLIVLFLAIFLNAAVARFSFGDPSKTKPNFVFILADDCTYTMLGCYGGKDAQTPNIDQLAREGLRFTKAYAAMAMCAPFRAELYTGLYPVRNGVSWNHSSAKPGTKSVCHYLAEQGYRVGLSGKKHASPAASFPFEVVGGFPAGDGVREFITRDQSQPYCLFLCSHNAHAAWTTGDASRFDAAKIQLSPIQHDNPKTREVMTRYLAEVEDLDRETGEIVKLLDETKQQENTLLMFSSEQGWALGFAKWSNWDLGVHTGLIAHWPGKIPAGTVSDELIQMTDVLPTFLEAAGAPAAAGQLDGFSFYQHLLDPKKSTARKFVYGMHNNVPEGNPYPIRSIRGKRFHYIQNLTSDASYHEKHIMAKDSRLIWWSALKEAEAQGDTEAIALLKKFHDRPSEELYKPEVDPYETVNLASNPEHAAAKQLLEKELARWMLEQQDPGAALDTASAYAAHKKAAARKKLGTKKQKK